MSSRISIKSALSSVLLFLALSTLSQVAHAQGTNISWSAAADGVWSNANNWTPHQVPGVIDFVTFDTSSQKNCTVDGAQSAASISMAANFTGSILFATNGQLNVNGPVTMSGGTIDARGATAGSPASSIVFGGSANQTTVSGGTFECGTKLVIFGGTGLVVQGGTVNSTDSIECRMDSFFQTAGTYNGSATLTTCFRNWQRSGGTFNPQNGLVAIGNSNNQQSNLNPGGAPFYKLSILNSGNTVFLMGDILVQNNFINHNSFQCSGFNTTITGTALIELGGAFFCQGSVVNFNGGVTLQTGGLLNAGTGTINVTDINILGNSSTNSVGSLALLSGSMNVSGNWSRPVNAFTGSFTASNTTVNFTKASGTQTLDTGGAANGGSDFFALGHTGAGILQLVNNPLSMSGSLALSAGTFDTNSQSVTVGGASTLSDSAGSVTTLSIPGGTATFTNTLSLTGAKISGAGTLAIGTVNATKSTVGQPVIQNAIDLTAGTRTITVSNGADMLTLSAVLSNGGITKAGSGVLALSGTSSFSGATTISSGTLQVDGSLTNSAVTVANGGTLSGTGMVKTLAVNTGGTVSPGDGIGGTGALTVVSSTVSFASGSSLILDINGTQAGQFDQLIAKGLGLTLNGTLTVNSSNVATTPTTRFTLIDNQTTGLASGTFTGVAQGATVTVNGQAFTIDYGSGVGNDVVLIAPNVAPSIDTQPSAIPNTVEVFQGVQFAVGASDANGDTLTYAWNFGDGGTGTGANPIHGYATAGPFTATVTVSDGKAMTSAMVSVTVKSVDVSVRYFAGVTPNATEGANAASRFAGPDGVALDAAGNIYIADTLNHVIRKLTPQGASSTIAGRAGVPGTTNGASDVARFNSPQGIALDTIGNIFIADALNNCIRKIAPDGTVSTFAGVASPSVSGFANGQGSAASFHGPIAVTVAPSGNIYVTDQLNNAIRVITPGGMVTTVAGDGTNGTTATNGPVATARFNFPSAVAVTGPAGNEVIYVADTTNHVIRKIANGQVTTYAGSTSGFADANGVNAKLFNPRGIVLDLNGVLYVAEITNHCIRQISTDGDVMLLAGATPTPSGGGTTGFADGTGTAATLGNTFNLAIDANGTLYAPDAINSVIRTITTPGAVVSTIAGKGTRGNIDGNPGLTASSVSVCTDSNGIVYVAFPDNTIRKIAADGTVKLLAGLSNVAGFTDGQGSVATFRSPHGMVADAQANIYVADTNNHAIRKIASDGTVTTIVGTGSAGHADLTGTNASFNAPIAISRDEAGNLYVADSKNYTIRKIDIGLAVTTIAGQQGLNGNIDNANGANAKLGLIAAMVYAGSGVLYVSDNDNSTIRKVLTTGTFNVSTIAGTGSSAGTPVDGAGIAASFRSPSGIGVDSNGAIYVIDSIPATLRKITTSGMVVTVAGQVNVPGYADGVGPTVAHFNQPSGLAVGPGNKIYICDSANNAIRLAETALPDTATIDIPTGPALHLRQLNVSPNNSTTYNWSIERRPFGSACSIANPLVKSPTVTPDVVGLYTFRVTAVGATGSATTRVDFVATPSTNAAPVLASSANATPNPALAGQAVTFTTSATDADLDILTYAWNFGDGSTGTAASTTHTYSSVGTFTASVTISDGIAPAIDGGSVMVTINPAPSGGGGGGPFISVIGSGLDTDGDGFSDSFEMAAGTNANDINSTPTGKPITAADILGLSLTKVGIKLAFTKPNLDSITVSGTLKVADGFLPNGKLIVLSVGGVTKPFTLTSKGAAKTADGTVKFTFKTMKKVIIAQPAKFTITLPKGSFATTLGSVGLTSTPIKNHTVPLQFTVVFDGNVLQVIRSVVYTATTQGTGSAK